MFQIKDGTISLNKSKQLSPKQLAQLNRIESDADKNRYLLSLMGLLKGKQPIRRFKSAQHDHLSYKPKNSFYTRMKSLRDVTESHRPSNKDVGNWVGVEIECFIPHQDGDNNDDCCCEYDDGTDNDPTYLCNSCSGNSHWGESEAHRWLSNQLDRAKVSRCQVKYDSSLESDEGHGVEVTILFNSSYGFEPLERLCSALKKAGCFVNKTCGLHVHLDVRHLTAKPIKVRKIGESIGHALPVIKWLVPESRHENNYCNLGVSKITGSERYYAVNLTAFRKYKTIEIRLHSGSINADKITNWISILKVVSSAKLKTDITTFQELIDLDGMTDTMVSYADARISELNPGAWGELMKEPVIAPMPVLTPLQTEGEARRGMTEQETQDYSDRCYMVVEALINEGRVPYHFKHRMHGQLVRLGITQINEAIEILVTTRGMIRPVTP